MYPQAELTRLARRKLELRQRIAVRRADCVTAATRATRPLVWLDRVLDLWRRIPPLARLAVVPLAGMALHAFSRRTPRLRLLLRWAPLAFGLLRSFRRSHR